MKTLIVTADDFGADIAVNEAVEQGHRHGILTAASLMVAGRAAGDAVARAKAMPGLGVGLHLVLVEGRPMLPAHRVPDLVGADGCFRTDMARLGADIFFRPAVRRQVAAEIEAQFAAFAATGLPLDHVNAHKHFHLHPTIAGLVRTIGARHGMAAARAPIDPAMGAVAALSTLPWARLLRRGWRRAGISMPDHVHGLRWSGAMTTARVRDVVAGLSDGVSELYCHPATADRHPGHAPGYRYRDELAALVDPEVRSMIAARDIRLARFADLAAA